MVYELLAPIKSRWAVVDFVKLLWRIKCYVRCISRDYDRPLLTHTVPKRRRFVILVVTGTLGWYDVAIVIVTMDH